MTSHSEYSVPLSPYEQLGGLVYLPRMLDKIRLMANGTLHPDYRPYLGQGFDGRCCRYLHIDYAQLSKFVADGASDPDALTWIHANGKTPNSEEILAWNAFASKRGWNDDASEMLASQKTAAGLANRNDLLTLFDLFEFEEGRKA